jgi:adenine deaminase
MKGETSGLEGAWSQVRVAMGREPADLVLRNCRIVNVYSGEIHPADIAIRLGTIVALRQRSEIQAERSIDARNAYAVPGFVGRPAGFAEAPCTTMDKALGQLRGGKYPFLAMGDTTLGILEALRRRGIDTSRICLVHGDPAWAAGGDAEALSWGRFVSGAIGIGIAPAELFAMTSLNPSILFGVDHRVGSISPGRQADLFLLEDIDRFPPTLVLRSGQVTVGASFLNGPG